ncbi:MAG: helix-turn-helix transcriptional regulator [Rhodospirillales bacterium]|nr:helix-turn-helix transcriptional regulator [Rhodospirillales bacterium]
MPEKTEKTWDLSAAVDALGGPDFARLLLVAFNQLVEVNHLVIIRIDRDLVPHLIATESHGLDPVARQAGERYTKLHLYHADPNMNTILQHPLAPEKPLVTQLLTDAIADPQYRLEVFEKSNIVERVSIINQRNGRWFMVNIYRDRSVGVFNDTELARITREAGLVSSLAAQHLFMMAREDWSVATQPPLILLENTLRAIGGNLSRREVEVCARALLGMTSEATGLDLAIKQTTVTTHRKRAYGKLNISTTNELFALCLGHSLKTGNT